MGLLWDPKKCTFIHVRKDKQAKDAADLKLDETALVENLKTRGQVQGCERVQDLRREVSTYSRSKDVIARLSIA